MKSFNIKIIDAKIINSLPIYIDKRDFNKEIDDLSINYSNLRYSILDDSFQKITTTLSKKCILFALLEDENNIKLLKNLYDKYIEKSLSLAVIIINKYILKKYPTTINNSYHKDDSDGTGMRFLFITENNKIEFIVNTRSIDNYVDFIIQDTIYRFTEKPPLIMMILYVLYIEINNSLTDEYFI